MSARGALAVALLVAFAPPAAAADDPAVTGLCAAPESLYELREQIDAARAAVQRRGALAVVVLGTASSSGRGLSAPDKAYPARLQAALAARLPKAKVSVAVRAASRRTAADMLAAIGADVAPLHPDLVVWQTGSVDAVRGVDEDTFARTLLDGIDALKRAGADVVLMDMQYSPYTGEMVNLSPYRRRMTWVSQVSDVPLFRRYDIMEYWYRNGSFDLEASGAAAQRMADRIHDCIGRLLADMVAHGVVGDEAKK